MRKFDAGNAEDIRMLREQVGRGEHEKAKRIVHTMKGAAGVLGLMRLMEAASNLEVVLHDRESEQENDDDMRHLLVAVIVAQRDLHTALSKITG